MDQALFKMKNRPYFIGLDILRFFAALAVFVFHLQLHFPGNLPFTFSFSGQMGSLAVSFFFVLSGFLLSYLLFLEDRLTGGVNILRFYLRRTLRIWPLYFIVLFFSFLVYPWLLKATTGELLDEKASAWRYALFVGNFDVAYFSGPTNSMLGVQWSLCVEEQFYLFLPFFFLALRKHGKVFLAICFALFTFSIVYKLTITRHYDTLSVMYSLFAGVALAVLAFKNKASLSKIAESKFFLVPAAFISIAYFVMAQFAWDLLFEIPYMGVLHLLIESFIFMVMIYTFAFNKTVEIFINNNSLLKNVATLGKKHTYSLYLMHMIGITLSIVICRWVHLNGFFFFAACSLVFTAVLCFLGNKIIEEKTEQLKKKFY